jgi:cytochrome c oxidase cbb3-type subunit 3
MGSTMIPLSAANDGSLEARPRAVCEPARPPRSGAALEAQRVGPSMAAALRLCVVIAVLGAVVPASAQLPAQPPARSEASPAARPVPETATRQTYPADLIEAGRLRFAAECGFCHGRDAAGASGGADLTRSDLVAQDVRGDRIGPVVRAGRIDAGMPAFAALAESDLAAIVAYVHDQQARAEAAEGGRRSVEVADLQTGNAAAGRRYFADNCAGCHSASGDLAGVADRFEGLRLLQRMLYPGSEGGTAQVVSPTLTVTAGAGRTITGTLVYRDEFTVALVDEAGRYRSWSTSSVDYAVSDPLEAHVEQLPRYTDEAMHDVLAYLQTLRKDRSHD